MTELNTPLDILIALEQEGKILDCGCATDDYWTYQCFVCKETYKRGGKWKHDLEPRHKEGCKLLAAIQQLKTETQ